MNRGPKVTRIIDAERIAGSQRKAYQPQRLSVLGDVGTLTETGSLNGQEDLVENGVCTMIDINNINNMYNMC